MHGCFTAVTAFRSFVKLVRAIFITRYIHTPFPWQFGGFVVLVRAFLQRGIFTHLFVLFTCVRLIISVHGWFTAVTVFRSFVKLVRAFLERGIFIHLFALFICARLIISVHGWFTAVTVRHELSRIVAARANLATRLGSSRSVNFFRGRYILAEVHFRYPFSRHDFRCDGRDSRWRFVTDPNYPANRHDPSRNVTLFVTRYGSGVLEMSDQMRSLFQVALR